MGRKRKSGKGSSKARVQKAKMLNSMIGCSSCTDIGQQSIPKIENDDEKHDWQIRNLPTFRYIMNQAINHIFSNGLTTGDEEQDEKILKPFLYAQNRLGVTNYNVLREAVHQAFETGKSGVRWLDLENGIINVQGKNYACLLKENEEFYGFKDVIAYMVSIDDERMSDKDIKNIKFDMKTFESQGYIIDKDLKIIILSKNEFLNLRNDTTKNDGESPLNYDLQRTELIASTYRRLNHDLNYDGPGRIIVRMNDGYIVGGENEVSTGEILNATTASAEARRTEIKTEVEEMGKQLKSSSSDSVIVMSNMFDKNIEHLPKVTKATEYFAWLENEGVMIAQMLGLSPALFSLGRISGNISMEKIIDNAMLNGIIPLRELFAVQISAFLAEKLGVEKIYFNKYEMKQVKDENDVRTKIVNMIDKLRRSGDNGLADKLVAILESDLDAGNGELKKLSAKKLNILDKIKIELRGGI